jgi:hypothetical protein
VVAADACANTASNIDRVWGRVSVIEQMLRSPERAIKGATVTKTGHPSKSLDAFVVQFDHDIG